MHLSHATLPLSSLTIPVARLRKHSLRQRKKAKLIFSEQGIVTPLIVDANHYIIDGILRFEIAKELGLQELNAVVVSDANDAEISQLELSLNRLAEDSKWDQRCCQTNKPKHQ
jgi:ParB-like chromosome segregation protein Spo0J